MTLRSPRAAISALLFFLLALAPIRAQEAVLRAEFWAESEPLTALPSVVEDAAPKSITPEQTAEALLSEARRVFSGMVWGFQFVYVPSDKARGVAEVFELSPLGQIPWGDPRLTVSDLRTTGTQLRAYLEYRPDGFGAGRMESWQDVSYESAQGRGSAPLAGGSASRFEAMDEAAKEALRNLLRPIVKNKPREIRGIFAYAAAPRLVIAGGSFIASLRIRVRVTEIRPYTVY